MSGQNIMANAQVTFNMTMNGKTVNNVTNWELPDNLNQTTQDLVDGIRASFTTSALTSLSPLWVFSGCTVRFFDGSPPFSTIFPFTLGNLAGTGISQDLPASVSLLVSTSYNGPRPNRGRVFFAGLVEGAWDGASWDPTTETDFQGIVQTWITGIGTSSGSAHLRIVRPNYLTNTWTLNNPAETAIVRPFEGTQRRRRIK